MSVFAGPKISNNGLVFEYDMSNTQKSWNGAPATNLLTYSQTFSNWQPGGTITLEYGSQAPDNTLTATKITNSVSSNIRNWYSVTSGSVYCFSGYVKKSTSTTILVESNTAATGNVTFNFDTLAISASGAYSSPTVTPANYGWYRISVNITAASTALLYIFLYGNSYATGGTSFIWGAQLELGTYATPYIPTNDSPASRTNTQSIIDLTGNNTVTANSLTYTADNKFSFIGTGTDIGNYISLGNPNILNFGTGNFTLSFVTNRTAFGFQGGAFISKGDGTSIGFDTRDLKFYVFGSTGLISSIDFTTPIGVWQHHVLVFDRTVSPYITYYLNGKINSTSTVNNASNITSSIDTSRSLDIGRSQAGGINRYFNGQMPYVQIYNRALSPDEVQQNFNAVRSRYGI